MAAHLSLEGAVTVRVVLNVPVAAPIAFDAANETVYVPGVNEVDGE